VIAASAAGVERKASGSSTPSATTSADAKHEPEADTGAGGDGGDAGGARPAAEATSEAVSQESNGEHPENSVSSKRMEQLERNVDVRLPLCRVPFLLWDPCL
jgi:hypothetical protein